MLVSSADIWGAVVGLCRNVSVVSIPNITMCTHPSPLQTSPFVGEPKFAGEAQPPGVGGRGSVCVSLPAACAAHHQELSQTRLHGKDRSKGTSHVPGGDLHGLSPSGQWGQSGEVGKWGTRGREEGGSRSKWTFVVPRVKDQVEMGWLEGGPASLQALLPATGHLPS